MSISIQMSDIKLGDVISATLYGNAIPSINEAKVIGFSQGNALRDPSSGAINHANIYAALPAGSEVDDDYQSYEYLVLRKQDQTIIEIGKPWVRPESLVRLERKTLRLEISDFDESRLAEFKELLDIKKYGTSYSTTLMSA